MSHFPERGCQHVFKKWAKGELKNENKSKTNEKAKMYARLLNHVRFYMASNDRADILTVPFYKTTLQQRGNP